MKCVHPRCSCGTVDGGFCSEACAAAPYEGNHDDACGCGHAGCRTTRTA